jgi:hypothetical protein
MVLDPDGCDFWYTTEYYGTSGLNWQTRIGSFRLNPNCTTSGGGGAQSQTISFGTLPSRTYGDPDFTVAATASSGLPVSFTATDSCTVSGSTVHLTGAGSCTVTAHQAGDSTYAPAADVSQVFSIAQASQTISFAPLPDRTFGDPDFTVSATASSGLAVSFAASGQCTVSGSTVHLTAAGSCTIAASQGGNANYTAATPVQQSFAIDQSSAVHLTSTSTTEGKLAFGSGAWVNAGFHFRLAQANNAAVTVGATGNLTLPVHCSSASSSPVAGTITVPVSLSGTIPARSTNWVATNDQKSVLGWLGAVQATAICGPGATMYNDYNNEGATLDLDVTASAHTGQLSFQFHYHVPVAVRKTNTDCTNASDPNHNNACQASWSTAKNI